MFEKATKQKLRFKVTNGMVSVEDLWDLNLESLDALAKSLRKEVNELKEDSFIKPNTTKSSTAELKFEIVKHIIGVKLDEQEAKKVLAANKERKAQILKILADKQDESLKAKSVDELLKELESL